MKKTSQNDQPLRDYINSKFSKTVRRTYPIVIVMLTLTIFLQIFFFIMIIFVHTLFNNTLFNNLTSEVAPSGENMIDFWIQVASGVTVAAIVGVATWIASGRYHKRKIEVAPRKYVQHLDELINRGITEGRDNAILNARAIVSVRNDLRRSLVSISSLLNSEIDILQENVGTAENNSENTNENNIRRRRDANAASAYDTIQVLSRKWPSKKDQIEVELRKLLTEIGLDPNQM
jgi:hypothetical protein